MANDPQRGRLESELNTVHARQVTVPTNETSNALNMNQWGCNGREEERQDLQGWLGF